MEMSNSVFQDARGKWSRKAKPGQKHYCGERGGRKVKARSSSHRFRSQTGLSAKSRLWAHKLRLQV